MNLTTSAPLRAWPNSPSGPGDCQAAPRQEADCRPCHNSVWPRPAQAAALMIPGRTTAASRHRRRRRRRDVDRQSKTRPKDDRRHPARRLVVTAQGGRSCLAVAGQRVAAGVPIRSSPTPPSRIKAVDPRLAARHRVETRPPSMVSFPPCPKGCRRPRRPGSGRPRWAPTSVSPLPPESVCGRFGSKVKANELTPTGPSNMTASSARCCCRGCRQTRPGRFRPARRRS